MPILEQIPTTIRAGDSCQWYHADPDYSPDDEYVLTYSLLFPSGKISIVANDNGDGQWLVTLTAAANVLPANETISWAAVVTKDDERVTVNSGRLTSLPDLATMASHDGRTHIQKVLTALEARLEARASEEQLELTIGDKQVKLMTLGELIAAKKKYSAMLKQENYEQDLDQGLDTGGTIRVRLS